MLPKNRNPYWETLYTTSDPSGKILLQSWKMQMIPLTNSSKRSNNLGEEIEKLKSKSGTCKELSC